MVKGFKQFASHSIQERKDNLPYCYSVEQFGVLSTLLQINFIVFEAVDEFDINVNRYEYYSCYHSEQNICPTMILFKASKLQSTPIYCVHFADGSYFNMEQFCQTLSYSL